MGGHAAGCHEAALRLALRRDDLPDVRTDESVMRSQPFQALNILDLGCGQHPFPWVAGGPEYLVGRAVKAVVDLPNEPGPKDEHLWYDDRYGLNLDRLEQMDDPIPWMSWDVVIAIELIEHVENPWSLLRMISRWMRQDGIAIVSTPNLDGDDARHAYATSGHLKWFPPDFGLGHISPIHGYIFREMAERAGLEITGQAYNEPPPHWVETATDAEIAEVHETVQVWRLERRR